MSQNKLTVGILVCFVKICMLGLLTEKVKTKLRSRECYFTVYVSNLILRYLCTCSMKMLATTGVKMCATIIHYAKVTIFEMYKKFCHDAFILIYY